MFQHAPMKQHTLIHVQSQYYIGRIPPPTTSLSRKTMGDNAQQYIDVEEDEFNFSDSQEGRQRMRELIPNLRF